VVYTVEVEGIIFVLHAFQKKSKSGVATTKRDMDIVRQRLKEVDEYFQ
jgi:phage-related protein